MEPTKILLGRGVVTVGGVPVGITRGDGKFIVEREIRNIDFNGKFGPVKDMDVVDSEIPKFTFGALELFDGDQFARFYPGISVTALTGYNQLTGTLTISSSNYQDVVWTGTTKDGRQAIIELDDCLNYSNIEWDLADKGEVVANIEFTGTYTISTLTTPPWRIKYVTGTVREVTFTVTALVGGAALAGAEIVFNYARQTTNVSGVSVFSNVAEDTNVEFTVIKGGYQTYFGSVDVNGVEAVSVELTAV